MRQKKFWFRMSGILAVLATALLLPTGAAAASTFKVLHEFTGKDGANPDAGLIFDAAGNLYGTTSAGGAFGKGTVFKLTPNSNGSWTETVLHSFCVRTNCADGFNPVAGLIFDGAGNLYGTTPLGPGGGSGVVFKLKPNADGTWTEIMLHSFTGSPDRTRASCRSHLRRSGKALRHDRLWGASSCSNAGCGVVFKLTPNSDGSWTESVLYSFCSLTNCADGQNPVAGLTLGRSRESLTARHRSVAPRTAVWLSNWHRSRTEAGWRA